MKILKFCSLVFVGSIFLISCTKDFDQINTNPASYSQSDFDPNFLLTSAQLAYTGSAGSSYEAQRTNLIYTSTMMQGLASVLDFWAGDKYMFNDDYTGAYWGGLRSIQSGAYPVQVRLIVDLIQITKDKPEHKNLYQISRIMKALIMERITDLYGDVPYFGAGLAYYSNDFQPVYDKQHDIYIDLLKEVEEATASLDDSADKPAGDIIYNGNIEKWRRFGNTLLLRMGMRLTKVDPALAQVYVSKVQGRTMMDNADNALVRHDPAGGNITENRNNQTFLGDAGVDYYYVKWSETFIDFLKSTDDPRLGKVAVTKLYLSPSSTIQNGMGESDPLVQKGMPNGKDLSSIPGQAISLDPSFTAFPDYSSPNPFMIKRDGPTFILTYAESELLLADAAQRWGIGGDAATHYNNGVKAAMTYLGQYDPALEISDTDADNYLSAHPYVAVKGLEMINSQYWAHTITMIDFYETWSNWRRTGFPILIPVNYPGNITGGTIPRRLPYPLSEASFNPVNYKAASDAVPGGDNLTGRVWWDQENF